MTPFDTQSKLQDTRMNKSCRKCGDTERYANGACVQCVSLYGKKWRAKNPEKARATTAGSVKAFRARNKLRWSTEDAYANSVIKDCGRCFGSFPSTDFFKLNSTLDGLDWCCKRCSAQYAKDIRRRSPKWFLVQLAKTRARKNKLAFNITADDLELPDRCPVLGIPLRIGYEKLWANSPSLDRINPSLGYVKGNVRVISHRANTLKSNATSAELELILADLKRLNQ